MSYKGANESAYEKLKDKYDSKKGMFNICSTDGGSLEANICAAEAMAISECIMLVSDCIIEELVNKLQQLDNAYHVQSDCQVENNHIVVKGE